MIAYSKTINSFNKGKNEIKKDILLIGSGRWGKILLEEINKNFINIKNIYVFTNYPISLKKWIYKKKYKNICIFKNISDLKKINTKFALIANKNKDHFKFCKKLLYLGYNILVEKPFVLNLKNYKKLIQISKNKKLFLLLGLQFFYAYYFSYIKKKIIKKYKINNISFEWFDKKNEKKNNLLKKHDVNINYIEDVFYHIYSIVYIFLGKGSFKFGNEALTNNHVQSLVFRHNKCNINLNCSRKWNQRKRIIKFKLFNGNTLSINFSNDSNLIVKLNNRRKKIPQNLCEKTLKYQLYSFFKLKNYKTEKRLNDVRNLNTLFYCVSILNKKHGRT